jgi:hypothetical protein
LEIADDELSTDGVSSLLSNQFDTSIRLEETTISKKEDSESDLKYWHDVLKPMSGGGRPLYFRRTPIRTAQIDIKEASKQLGKDLKKLNSLRKEKGYGKATAEEFAHLGISRLYEIAEHYEELWWMFSEKNILIDNPQRKERCISLLEELHPINIESNKDLIKLVNSTRPKAIIDQKV